MTPRSQQATRSVSKRRRTEKGMICELQLGLRYIYSRDKNDKESNRLIRLECVLDPQSVVPFYIYMGGLDLFLYEIR
jgi:hypothetical protein